MNAIKEVLNVMQVGEELFLKEVTTRIQSKTDKPLTISDKSNIRGAVLRLFSLGMIDRLMVGDLLTYKLVKPKEEYKPVRQTYAERNARKIRHNDIIKDTVEWYAIKSVASIERLCELHNIPLPKTREDIFEFHKIVTNNESV